MIILSIEQSQKILSISISNDLFLFYKEIHGDFVGTKHTLYFVNKILIKNKLNYKDISILIVNSNIEKLTSMKVFFSIMQTLAITHSIPLFQINSLDSIAYEIYKKNKKKYLFIEDENFKFNMYFIYKNTFMKISNNKYFNVNLLYFNTDASIYFKYTTNMKVNNKIYSKSIYLTLFFNKDRNTKIYIIPNSSNITYKENNKYKSIINE